MKEFSIRVYEELLEVIKKTGWPVFTVRAYFSQRQAPPAFFVLRHDVDRRPERALRMALVEKSHGIQSTYYFRMRPHVFLTSIIERIASMGHEIGYHYEVLDKAKGEVALAHHIFMQELADLRSIADVKTAAMHGNPLSCWDNRDFWSHHQPGEFGLEGEAYVSMKEEDLLYATDTGRGWNRSEVNLLDRFPAGSLTLMPSFRSTRELTKVLEQKRFKKIYLQVHPNRWTSGFLEGTAQRAEDLLLNTLKKILIRIVKRRTPA